MVTPLAFLVAYVTTARPYDEKNLPNDEPPHRNYCSHEAVSYLVDFFVFSIVGDAGVLEFELAIDLALGTLTEALTQRR